MFDRLGGRLDRLWTAADRLGGCLDRLWVATDRS